MTEVITINSKGIVPNHLNDTNIFCRYSKNSIIDVEPKEVHFSGYKINEKNYQELKFTNISDEICRFHIIPPVSKYFRLQYKKLERMVPGFFVTCTVIFCPDKVRNYNDFIKIHTKDSENNIVVPIYAYPAIKGLEVPRNIKFPITAIGRCSKRQISLHSDSEMDFEFEIIITKEHPSIVVDPLHGVIPGRGDKIISLEFRPTAYVTCETTINIYVDQYNFQPIVCSLFGVAQPGIERNKVFESYEKESVEKSSLLSIVKLESKRRGFGARCSMTTFSDKLFNKGTDGRSDRQQLKVDFEARVMETVNNERQNQLRWQSFRGCTAMKDEEIETIKRQRESALEEYQLKIRSEKILFNLYRNSGTINNTWIKTICLETENDSLPDNIKTPQFVPECWFVRKYALDRFRSAAWLIIINARLRRRFKVLYDSGGNYREVDNSHMNPGGNTLSFVRDLHGISVENLPMQRSTFTNNFDMSEYKVTLPIRPNYEFQNLIVPFQMHVLGYERIDMISLSYIPEKANFTPKLAAVVDASGTFVEQSQASPVIYSGTGIPTLGAHDDKDRSLIPFWPSCSFYDKHSFFPLYYYKNELMEVVDPEEMEWKTAKSAFLVSRKAVKSITSDHLIRTALDCSLFSRNVPDLLTVENMKEFDYQSNDHSGTFINQAMMIQEFPFLETLKENNNNNINNNREENN